MQKLLIDATSLLSPLTGIARYTYEISSHLANNFDTYYNYGHISKQLRTPATASNEGTIHKLLKSNSTIKRLSRHYFTQKARFYRDSFDIYFQPNFIPNRYIKTKKTIATIHDLSFLHNPAHHPPERIEYLLKNLHLLKNTDHIITVSNFVADEVSELLGIDSSHITAIHNAINHDLYRPYAHIELSQTAKKHSLPPHFLLYVGSIEPRKNLLSLLYAYDKLPQYIKKDLPLILIGFSGWQNSDILKLIEQNKNHIRYLGYVTDAQLAHIYNLATIFIYPSLYEGFGLPPLEAMACGTAVITSSLSSLPEVCGDAAYYIDPHNIESITHAITTLYDDRELLSLYRSRSITHASKFDWQNSADAHTELFNRFI